MSSEEEDDLMTEDGSSSDSSTDPEPEEEIRKRVPALATGRERRSNAGAKMQALLSNLQQTLAAEDNEFYSTAYGGLNDEDEDNDFDEGQEEADDELDSDFDTDETQLNKLAEEEGQEEEDDSKKTRKSRKAKLAYEVSAQNRARKEQKAQPKAPKPAPKPRTIPVKRPLESPPKGFSETGKRILRTRVASSKKESDDEEIVPKKKPSKRNRKKKVDDPNKVWTQEELLKEAKKTEIENLASLKKYQLLELEKIESKKRIKRTEKKAPASYIRYVSTGMPLVSEVKSKEELTTEKVARTFIAFSDDQAFESVFPPKKPEVPKEARKKQMDIKKGQAICPISHLRARYFDPVTMMPFASSTTFKALREAYCQQLELYYAHVLKPEGVNGDESVAVHHKMLSKLKADGVIEWLEYRRKNKKQKTSNSNETTSTAASSDN